MRKLILPLMVIALGVFTVSCSSGKQTNSTETQNEVQAEETTQAEEQVDTEKHTYSELFTDDQIREIRRGLKVPDDIEVIVKVGNSYFWEGANMYLAQVDFYHDGEYCAGAACEVGTSNIVKNIYSY